jgi:hypothetical protein
VSETRRTKGEDSTERIGENMERKREVGERIAVVVIQAGLAVRGKRVRIGSDRSTGLPVEDDTHIWPWGLRNTFRCKIMPGTALARARVYSRAVAIFFLGARALVTFALCLFCLHRIYKDLFI